MSGSNQGWWMASSITEEDIRNLREAKYLPAEIPHRLPAQGQVVPTPKPNESIVFTSHFLRGLGFSVDPFVRGLMFYYGLDFLDLAPDSVLHISSFIVVCESFLRIPPTSPMAQDLQCEAEGDRRASRGVRRLYNKQRRRRPMAKGFLPGGVRLMATGVVLHHSSPRHKARGRPCLPLGPPATTGVMGQQGAGLGAS